MGRVFWDASAVVPLVMEEKGSRAAGKIWLEADPVWSWNWLPVEVDAALTRRRAGPSVWRNWRELESRLNWIALETEDYPRVRLMNRELGLRAADAGYVFLFERLSAHLDGLAMATFDREMAEAVQSLGLQVHPDCAQPMREA
jgi:predicted nucleic acid-binding protein